MEYFHRGYLIDTAQELFSGTILFHSTNQELRNEKPFKELTCPWFTQLTWTSLQRIYSHSSHNGLYKYTGAGFYTGGLRAATDVVMAGRNSLEAINLRHYCLCWPLYHLWVVQSTSEQITCKQTQIFLHKPQSWLWPSAASPGAKAFHVQMSVEKNQWITKLTSGNFPLEVQAYSTLLSTYVHFQNIQTNALILHMSIKLFFLWSLHSSFKSFHSMSCQAPHCKASLSQVFLPPVQ